MPLAVAWTIGRVNFLFDPTMKARVFPVMRTPQMSVSHRIVVYVTTVKKYVPAGRNHRL